MPDDAFGNEGGAPEAEVVETDLSTPQGQMVEVEEHEPDEDHGADDWRQSIEDPELREKVGGKYQSPTELARAYAEAERRLHQQAAEQKEMESFYQEQMRQAQYESMPQNGYPPQQGPQAPPDFNAVNEFAQWTEQRVRNGEIDEAQGMREIANAQTTVYQQQLDARMAAIEEQVEARLQQSLAPVQSFQTQQAMSGQIAAMKKQYGEEGYAGLAPKAAEYLRQWGAADPGFVSQPGAIHTAFDRAAADAYREGRRSAQAHTLDGSGPGLAPRSAPSDAEQIIEGILAAGEHASGDWF